MMCYNIPKVFHRKTGRDLLHIRPRICVLEERVLGRRESREHAMKLLYQVQIRKDDVDEQIRTYIEEEQIPELAERDYIEDVVRGVTKNQGEIDSILSRHAKGWTISRMPKVDLAIMRLSVYEMHYRKDIPVNVSINEAVELAKKYSGDQSRTFINGVLGKVWNELSQNAGEPGDHEQSDGK